MTKPLFKVIRYIPVTLALIVLLVTGIGVVTGKQYTEPLITIIKQLKEPLPATRSGTFRAVLQKRQQTSSQDLAAAINQYRQNQDLPYFQADTAVCQSQSLETTEPEDLTKEQIFSACANCSHTALIGVENAGPADVLLAHLLSQDSAAEILQNPKLTHFCIKESKGQFTLLFTAYQPQAPSDTSKPVSNPPQPVKNFTEDELWQALVDYRHAHHKPDLLKNENICIYARQRVQEHIQLFKDKDRQDYPVSEKYPLDAHQGFARDAESGKAFEVTGMTELAENLAFWPTADHANQIIEWGWDTSTEGHREAQLTEKYNQACITGENGFFVAIFGK